MKRDSSVAKFGRTRCMKMRAEELAPHPVAQRPISKHNLAKKEPFSPELTVIHIVFRNGKYYIVDGQHRWFKLVHEYGLGEWVVDCIFHEDVKTDAQAAALFRVLNTQQLPRKQDTFAISVVEGDRVAVGVERVLRSLDLSVGRTPTSSTVACVDALQRAYRLDNAGVALGRAFALTTGAWGRTKESYDGVVLFGAAIFFQKHGDDVDVDAVARKVGKRFAQSHQLLAFAKSNAMTDRSRSTAEHVAKLIAGTYNSGKRSSNRLGD